MISSWSNTFVKKKQKNFSEPRLSLTSVTSLTTVLLQLPREKFRVMSGWRHAGAHIFVVCSLFFFFFSPVTQIQTMTILNGFGILPAALFYTNFDCGLLKPKLGPRVINNCLGEESCSDRLYFWPASHFYCEILQCSWNMPPCILPDTILEDHSGSRLPQVSSWHNFKRWLF